MSEGNLFKDNLYIARTEDGYSDAGSPLLVETLAYMSIPGKKLWATKLMFSCPWSTGGMIGETIRMALYVPGINTVETPTDSPAVIKDLLISEVGWNEIVLDTPIALPVYSGTGPITKFGLAYYSPSSFYIAAGRQVPSGSMPGLYQSEIDSGSSATPSAGGYFRYGASFPPEGPAGQFNFWNGMDVQVTDVNPFPGLQNLSIGSVPVTDLYIDGDPVSELIYT